MRTVHGLLLILGLVSTLDAAQSFSSSLTPEQRERLGLAGLSAAQLAALDAAVETFRAGPGSVPSEAPRTTSSSSPAAGAPVALTPPNAPAVPAPSQSMESPVAAASSRSAGADKAAIVARVVGEFRGWSGGTYFPLDNGQVWRQVGSDSNELPPRRDARIEIYPSGNGYWRLRYDGAWITVRRLQ